MKHVRPGLFGIVLLLCSTLSFGQKQLYTEAAGDAEAFKAPVARAALNSTAKLLAAVATDKTIKVFDLATFRERSTLPGVAVRMSALAFSASGQSLFTCSPDGQVSVWNSATA